MGGLGATRAQRSVPSTVLKMSSTTVDRETLFRERDRRYPCERARLYRNDRTGATLDAKRHRPAPSNPLVGLSRKVREEAEENSRGEFFAGCTRRKTSHVVDGNVHPRRQVLQTIMTSGKSCCARSNMEIFISRCINRVMQSSKLEVEADRVSASDDDGPIRRESRASPRRLGALRRRHHPVAKSFAVRRIRPFERAREPDRRVKRNRRSAVARDIRHVVVVLDNFVYPLASRHQRLPETEP